MYTCTCVCVFRSLHFAVGMKAFVVVVVVVAFLSCLAVVGLLAGWAIAIAATLVLKLGNE